MRTKRSLGEWQVSAVGSELVIFARICGSNDFSGSAREEMTPPPNHSTEELGLELYE